MSRLATLFLEEAAGSGQIGLCEIHRTKGSFPALAWVPKAGRAVEQAIWENELPGFIRSIALLSDRLQDFSHFDDAPDGWYPLTSRFNEAGGLSWAVEIKNGKRSLTYQRFSGTQGRDDGAQYTTYFLSYKRWGSRWIQQRIDFPESVVTSGAFSRFAESLQAKLEGLTDAILEELPGSGVPPAPKNLFEQVVVPVGRGRFLQCSDDLAGARVLERPILRSCLDLCQEQAFSISELHRELGLGADLSPKSLRRALPWTIRWDPRVLRRRAFLAIEPAARGKDDSLLATVDRQVFGADPLLISLDWALEVDEVEAACPEWLSIPQCKPSDFEAALDEGRAESIYDCRFGHATLPSESYADDVFAFLQPPLSLKRYRYKILQLMLRTLAEACNLPGDVEDAPALQWQRLQLLRYDVAQFFPEDEDNEQVLALCEEAHEVSQTLLAAAPQPRAVDEREELPQRAK